MKNLYGEQQAEAIRMLLALKGSTELLLTLPDLPEVTLSAIVGMPLNSLKRSLGYEEDAEGSDEFTAWMMKLLDNCGDDLSTNDPVTLAIIHAQAWSEEAAPRLAEKLDIPPAPVSNPEPKPEDSKPVVH